MRWGLWILLTLLVALIGFFTWAIWYFPVPSHVGSVDQLVQSLCGQGLPS